MRRIWDYAKLLGALGLVFLLLLWPAEALSAAQGAMRTWAGSVGPSLFPFLALLPMLTSPAARCAYARALGWLMRPLFRLPGSAAPALLIGLLAGSPAGALAVERVSEGLPRGEARRLGLMCAGVSPVYLVGGVGAALFGSAAMGLWLALAQAAGQLLLGVALRGRFAEDAETLPVFPEREREAPVRAAVGSVLQVCGYMALFSVAAAMAAKLLGGAAGDLLLYIADMPSGLARAAQTGAPWALAGAVAGFGGLCIAAQNMAVLRQLGARWRCNCAFPPPPPKRPWLGWRRARWRRPRWRRCCFWCPRCWPWPAMGGRSRKKNQTLNKAKFCGEGGQKGSKTAI